MPTAQRLAYYLSPEHRDQEDGGCPTSSLPGDVARQSSDAQQAFAAGLERYIDLIGDETGQDGAARREAAIRTLATIVGAITLSRAVVRGAPALSEELLRVGTEQGRSPS